VSKTDKEKIMFKRIKNERKMQIRDKRKDRLVKNPPPQKKESRKKRKRKNWCNNDKYFAIDFTPTPSYSYG